LIAQRREETLREKLARRRRAEAAHAAEKAQLPLFWMEPAWLMCASVGDCHSSGSILGDEGAHLPLWRSTQGG